MLQLKRSIDANKVWYSVQRGLKNVGTRGTVYFTFTLRGGVLEDRHDRLKKFSTYIHHSYFPLTSLRANLGTLGTSVVMLV